jgi:hypothetical protein
MRAPLRHLQMCRLTLSRDRRLDMKGKWKERKGRGSVCVSSGARRHGIRSGTSGSRGSLSVLTGDWVSWTLPSCSTSHNVRFTLPQNRRRIGYDPWVSGFTDALLSRSLSVTTISITAHTVTHFSSRPKGHLAFRRSCDS